MDPSRSYRKLRPNEVTEINALYDSLLFRLVPLLAKTALVIELIMTLYHYARNLRLACCMDDTVKHFLEMLPKFTQELRMFHSFIFLFRCNRVVKKVSRYKLGSPTTAINNIQITMERMADRYLLYPTVQIDLIISQISRQIHEVHETHPYLVGQTSYEEIWHLMLTIADGIINNQDIENDLKAFCEKANNDVKSAMVMQCLKNNQRNKPRENGGHADAGDGQHAMGAGENNDHGEGESKNNIADEPNEDSRASDVIVAIRQAEVISNEGEQSAIVRQQVSQIISALDAYVNYSLSHRSQLATIDSKRPHSNQQIIGVVSDVTGLANDILNGTRQPESVDNELERMENSNTNTNYGQHSFRYFFSSARSGSQHSTTTALDTYNINRI